MQDQPVGKLAHSSDTVKGLPFGQIGTGLGRNFAYQTSSKLHLIIKLKGVIFAHDFPIAQGHLTSRSGGIGGRNFQKNLADKASANIFQEIQSTNAT